MRLHSARIAFFFSSRRPHTRSLCDWSSDVCSSDLGCLLVLVPIHMYGDQEWGWALSFPEIGRASCRERVEITVEAEAVKRKVVGRSRDQQRSEGHGERQDGHCCRRHYISASG